MLLSPLSEDVCKHSETNRHTEKMLWDKLGARPDLLQSITSVSRLALRLICQAQSERKDPQKPPSSLCVFITLESVCLNLDDRDI